MTSGAEKQKFADEKSKLSVEACPSGMIMADSAGRIVAANTEIERMFGYRREEFIGQSVDIPLPERFPLPERCRAPIAETEHFISPGSQSVLSRPFDPMTLAASGRNRRSSSAGHLAH
jgi:PAS domain-containing protein